MGKTVIQKLMIVFSLGMAGGFIQAGSLVAGGVMIASTIITIMEWWYDVSQSK